MTILEKVILNFSLITLPLFSEYQKTKPMWKYALFFLCCICFSSCVKQVETIETKDDNGKLLERITRKKKDFARHGTYTKYFSSGKIEEEAQYQNDTLHGKRILFYDTGDTLIVETHSNGLFEGPYASFHSNGVKESHGSYVKGAMSGEWNFYYDNKQLKEVVQFTDNEENGPFVEYHSNGNLKAKGTYKTTSENVDGNKEHGPLELYSEDGQLERKMDCVLGVCRTTWSKEAGEKEKE